MVRPSAERPWWPRPLLLALVLAAAGASPPASRAGDGEAREADVAAAVFPLAALDGSAIDFDAQAPCHVIAFLGVGCPVARQYGARLEEIARDHAGRGVRVIGVDANRQDSSAEFAAAAREMGITFPLAMDPGQATARALGAVRTGGVVVLDRLGRIAYAGRVDDQFAPGVAKPEAGSRELLAALDDILAGRPVALPRTEAVGCLITFDRAATADAASAPTFAGDVLPMLQAHCMECHRSGEIGPFDVSTLDEVSGWAAMMLETMEQGRMPPWHASAEHGAFKNERHLPAGAIDLFRRWIDAGMPAGDAAAAPAAPAFVDGWRLPAAPDIVAPLGKRPYRVPASGTVDYQYFVADPHVEEETWVRAAQVIPGAPSVVHHAIVFARPENLGDFRGLGLVSAYVPGQRATTLPPGHARRIPARSKFVFQMHYTPDGRERDDLTTIGLVTIPREEVTHEVMTLAALDQDFEIPPHAAAHPVRAELSRWPAGSSLLAVSPHMHVRGRAFEIRARRAGGTETLLSVPRYDFNWQHTYEFTEPVPLDGIEAIEIEAVFDNSSGNPVNPAPEETVMWGDQTWEEMALAFVEIASPLAPAAAAATTTVADGARPPSPGDEPGREALERADDFLRRFDADGDGAVVRTEASRIVRDYSFGILDEDGDGRVTRDEAARKMRSRRGR